MGVPGDKGEKGAEIVFEETVTENLPYLKDTNLHIKETTNSKQD